MTDDSRRPSTTATARPPRQTRARVGGWELSGRHEPVAWTDHALELLQCRDLEPRSWAELLPHFAARGREALRVALLDLESHGSPLVVDATLHAEHGRLRVRITGDATSNPDGSRRLFGTIQDIDDEQSRIDRLGLTERTLDKAMSLADAGVWSINTETRELTWSDQVFRIHDLEPTTTPPSVDRAISYYHGENARQTIGGLVARLEADGSPFDVELPLLTAKKRAIWVRAIGDRFVADDGTVRLFGVFQDITERKKVENDLRIAGERWWLALIGSENGVWDWNLETDDMFLSPPWKAMLGYEDHELDNVASTWRSLLHPDDLDPVLGAVDAYLRGESQRFSSEHRVRHRDGSWRVVQCRGKVAEWNDTGRPTRFIGTQTDVTEQSRMREELVEAKEAAETAVRARSDFLAVMSHEIRTPLNGVLGMTQVMLRSDLTPELQECAEAIYSSGDLLLSILNDILDFSKIEAGRLTLEHAPFDLRDSADQVIRLFAAPADQKGIALRLDYADDVPRHVVGDSARIRQVLMNLVGNAIKFTETGAITVRVRTTDDALVIEVEDTGIGMSADQAARVFDAFSQADVSTTRRYGGTGLGLTVCREIVELMGGGIEVRSEPGSGSTFVVKAPLEIASAPDPQPGIPDVRRSAPHRTTRIVRVLVVEDNPVNQMVATRLLKTLHCLVDVAAHGRDGVEMAARNEYDLIFMDCQMPEMDGYGATRLIRQAEARTARRSVIVAMTANVMPEDRRRAADAGMDDFVSKPVHVDDLARQVDSVRGTD